jgi:hypothetical protein
MLTTPTRPLWPLHAFGLPLLALLGWLIFEEKSRDFNRPAADSLGQTLSACRNLVDRSNQVELDEAEKISRQYPSSDNALWFRRAKRASELTEQARKQLEGFYIGRWGQPRLPMPDMTALADSLIALSAGDSTTAARVRTAIFDAYTPAPPTWWGLILKEKKRETTDIWYMNLRSRIGLAEEAALRHITPRVMEAEDPKFDAFDIGISFSRPKIYVGEPFEAEAYLYAYDRRFQNVRAFANDKELPMADGKALFSQTYRTPGSKIVKVRIDIHNPVTSQINSIAKEFAVEVLEDCKRQR